MADNKCKHHNICGLPAEANSENTLCILHSTDPKKDEQRFLKTLNEHRQKKGNSFQYFFFNKNADFSYQELTDADFSDATFSECINFKGAAS